MKSTSNKSDSAIFLRQTAEELLKKRQAKSGSEISEPDVFKLIHELEVHQIELEMQNEELMLTRSAAINSGEKYFQLYDFAPVGYFTLSREGKIIELNLCGSQMLEKERSYLENSYFASFVSVDTKPIFNLFLSKIFNSNSKESCELSLLKKNNVPMYAHLTGMVTGNGEQCLVNVIDITKRRQAEMEINFKNEELIKVNAEKDKFFSIMAHDLRGPLSSFLCLTKMFAEQLPVMKKKEIQEIANSLKESAARVFHLIENLLEWSRMKRGLIEFKPQSIPLIDIINKSIESLSDQADQKNQEIQLQVPENMIVNVDFTMLESTLRNLLSNAMKFSFRGGKILISAKGIQDNFIEIDITDNGIGMNSMLMSNLFQINGQKGRNGTEGEPSTGLGLLLCKEFVEKNGGKIQVESVEGKGSTFSFTLPKNFNPDSASF